MSKIKVMPLSLSNQIAAGEVVERPASVVKELVENAIDAGASQVDVRVEEAGLKRIEVVDNGSGIDNEDIEKAFDRHATSKLYDPEDLFRIRSLGFRGEALPSIASVSKLTIESSNGEEKARKLVLAGGHLEEDSYGPIRQGTSIVVEDLFYNTPARLKHIKSPQTELGHITDLMNRMAFAYPEIAFRTLSDGNMMTKTVGNGDLHQAIAGVYGVSTAKQMVAISEENFNYRVSGYISKPDMTRASRQYMTLIINHRVIKNFKLTRAIQAGYGSKLMVNRFPIAVIHIDMDPLLVDVNVHPTKDEVRISDEEDLGGLIQEAVQQALDRVDRIPQGLANIQANQTAKKEEKGQQTQIDFRMGVNESILQSEREGGEQTSYVEDPSLSFQHTSPDHGQVKQDQTPLDWAKQEISREGDSTFPFPNLDYFGQMHGTYLFAQNEEGLYIIDQHAAQERIKYEFFREEIGQESNDQQQLLLPLVLEYPVSDAVTIRESREDLEAVGLYLEDFGDQSFIVHSHPSWFEEDQVEGTVREMVDFLLTEDNLSLALFREATAIMMSCKRSIKANHYLDDRQARQLIEDLAQCQNPYNCPHGRPVLVKLTNADMEKMFKRIQD